MIACEDWRTCRPELIAPLIDDEVSAWRRQLDWDVTDAWRVVEPARRAGQLPGFVVTDGRGRVAGWTSFLLHRDCLQVMTLVGRNAAVVGRLLRSILESSEAERASSLLVCVRETSAGLREALEERGFRTEPYRYLCANLNVAGTPHATLLRLWDRDEDVMTRLCVHAYARSSQVRAFAPGGTWSEWREYIASLIGGPGCGRFQAAWSIIVPGTTPAKIHGGAIVTAIATGVAHIAQMAVSGEHRKRGLGRAMVTTAMAAAHRDGCRMMTLLVASGNTPAVRLYEGLGFEDRASFLVAMKDQPRVSTSLALATGGESTRL